MSDSRELPVVWLGGFLAGRPAGVSGASRETREPMAGHARTSYKLLLVDTTHQGASAVRDKQAIAKQGKAERPKIWRRPAARPVPVACRASRLCRTLPL